MSDYTPILHLPQVASNQEQKEATINTAIAILEAAMNDALSVSLAVGDVTLNTDQFTKYFFHQFSGHTVDRTVLVPNTPRWFAAENQGSGSIVFQVSGASGGALSAQLPPGRIGLLISDGNDLRFVVPDPANGVGKLIDLSDVAGVPTNGQLLRYDANDSQWKPYTLSVTYQSLTDAPDYNSSVAGHILGVNAAGSGLEWQMSAANVNSFVDLDDTPASYNSAGGRYVRVNNGGTGLVFATPSLLHNSDFPTSYTNQRGKFLQVDPVDGDAVIFAIPKLSDLADGPGQPTIDDALLYLRVNAAGTGLEFVAGSGGPVAFTELNDTPSSFVDQGGRVVRVGVDEDQLVFDTLALTELDGFPTSFAGAAGKVVRVNTTQTGVIFSELALKDLSDVPDDYVANRYLRINATGNGVEFVLPSLTELNGFPASFTGQGGKYLQVRPDEMGLRFSTTAVSVAFTDLTDSPASYENAANKLVAVNASASGLVYVDMPAIPTTLASLSDVTFATPPSDGQVLTYAGGQWIAAPGGSSSVASLDDLTDVDLTTTAPTNGQSLVFRDGQWVPETVAGGGPGATSLDDLTDVDLTTEPPTEGEFLTYVGGQWVAGPGGTSNVETLDDIEDVALTEPTSGQVLTYRDAGWVNESPQGAGVPSNGSHLHWRLLVNQTDGDPAQVGIQDIWFRRTKTGAQLATGGTATASSQESALQGPDGAFDGVIGGAWFSNSGQSPVGQWIAYQFAEPVEVRYLDLMGSQDYPTRSPRAFDVQWSDDGIAWTTAWSVTGQTGWAPSQIRQFHAPLDLFFTDLADAPPSFIGQALKALRVRADEQGLEFYAPVTSLDDLSDVDFSVAPAPNQVLAFVDGVWKAQAFTADIGGLNDLPDVELSAEPVAGSVLVYENGQWRDQSMPAPTFPSLTVDMAVSNAVSTSPFAMKGTAFTATDNFQLLALRPYLTGSAGETYVGMVASLTSDNKFDVLLAQTPPYIKPAGSAFAELTFDAPVTMAAGKRYALLAVRVDGTATSAANVAFPGTGGPGLTLPWMAYLGAVRHAALTPQPGVDAMYDQASYVVMGVRVRGLATEFALNDLTDVDLTIPPTDGQVLTYQDGQWIAGEGGSDDGVGTYRGPWGVVIVQRTVTFDAGAPEGFESAFEAGWTIVVRPDGEAGTQNALRAAAITHSSATEFSFDVRASEAHTTFALRYVQDSENTYDYLRVLVDGVVVLAAQNHAGFRTFTTALTPGPHTVTLRYAKDQSGSVGADTVFITQIVCPVEDSAPYEYGDVVDWNGERYFCLTPGTINDPSTTTDWQKMGGAGGSGALALEDLVDVEVADAVEGEVLTYRDGLWVAEESQGLAQPPAYRGPWGVDYEYRTVTFDAGTPEGFEAAIAAGWSITPLIDGTAGTENALRAATIGSNGITEFSIVVEAHEEFDVFSIRYRQDSELSFDFLTVLIDGAVAHSGKNLSGFQEFSTTLTPGVHTVTLRYSKDVTGSTGADTVYVTRLTIPQTRDTSAPYVYGDIISWSGARYTCLTPGTLNDPSSTTDWQVLADSLAALSDVDVTTDAPVEGDVLVYRSGQWIAGPTPAPAYRGAWTATPEDPYVAGDLVIQNGATWIGAVAMPTQQPGTGSDWIKISQRPMDVGFFFAGKPEASELLTRYQVRSAFSVAAGAVSVSAVGAATASYGLLLLKNGATFATATFAAGATTASITMGVEATFVEGDILTIQGASVVDTTLADLSVTMQAYRL